MSHKKEVMNVIISSFNNQGMTRLALDALLVDFESQIRQDKWIMCCDHVPKYRRVLVYHPSWGIEMSLTDKSGQIPIGLSGDFATHWMNLPDEPNNA